MYDHKKPKHGIRKLLWLAKIGDRICINLKKTIIAKPVQIIPKTVAEKKLFKLTEPTYWEKVTLDKPKNQSITGNVKNVAIIVDVVAILIADWFSIFFTQLAENA